MIRLLPMWKFPHRQRAFQRRMNRKRRANGTTYLSVMEQNLSMLKEALG